MNSILHISTVLVLLLIFIQDLKHRAIHILLPVVLFAIGLYQFYTAHLDWYSLICNAFFLVLTFAGLYMYLMLKNKKLIANLSGAIGLGDILFFIAVLPFFGLHNYILFFITGLIFSMICFGVFRLYKKSKMIPLAGLLGLYMIIIKGIDYLIDFDLFFGIIA